MKIFVSSVQGGMEAVREAAAQAIESLDMRPVMAERRPASSSSSRATLLGDVRECDAVLLLLGPHYGDMTETGVSATEDEFRAAVKAGVRVIALIQQGDRDEQQEEFVGRVRGTWTQGSFAPYFADEHDVGFAIVAALNRLRAGGDDAASREAAVERVLQLASERNLSASGRSMAAVVAVPITTRRLVDAVALTSSDLSNMLTQAMRDCGLADQSIGLEANAGKDGLRIVGTQQQDGNIVAAHIGLSSELRIEADVSADGQLGGMQVGKAQVEKFIRAASLFLNAVLAATDTQSEVSQVAIAVVVPDAQMKLYVTKPTGNSSRMPISGPQLILAPDPPLIVRVEDVGSQETTAQLEAALRLEFGEHGALDC